jgi:hypothetical protein
MPHYLIAITYPKLVRQVREDLQNVLLEFLADLAKNPESTWLGPPGDELLMLMDPVFVMSLGGKMPSIFSFRLLARTASRQMAKRTCP